MSTGPERAAKSSTGVRSMKTFVVPDAHGNRELVLGLLEQEEIVEDGKRIAGSEVQVIQLGDLANCVASSVNDDLDALALVGPVIDFMLIGNHEHPYFGGPAFTGFWPDPMVSRARQRLADYRLIYAAYAVDDILLTHAGLTEDFSYEKELAQAWAGELNELWDHDPTNIVFSMIGRSRGGWYENGGILWSDWSEPKSGKVRQIVGHTVGENWRAFMPPNGGSPTFAMVLPDGDRHKVSRLCLDVGAGKGATRILGAWVNEGEVTIVEYNAQ